MSDILERIVTQRRLDVETARLVVTEDALRSKIESDFPAAPLNLYDSLAGSGSPMIVAAEFKRASPSKGEIVPATTPIDAAVASYVAGGAKVLSVLTEPTWFKGTLADLEDARVQAGRWATATGRALILRKDFIVDVFQILEARAYGADTLLLIVAAIPDPDHLRALISASRALGMEPLVEVNTVEEYHTATACSARVMGINNRNLRTFTVDMGTTATIIAAAAAGVEAGRTPPAILSLSGLKVAADLRSLVKDCVAAAHAHGTSEASVRTVLRGFLVGEALMRASDPEEMVRQLVSAAAEQSESDTSSGPQLVKICGVRSEEDALHAARSGADIIGVVMVPGAARFVEVDTAASIAHAVRRYREQDPAPLLAPANALRPIDASDRSALHALSARFSCVQTACRRCRPLLAGVFMDQAPGDVAAMAEMCHFDLVQLHGTEDVNAFTTPTFAQPIIKVIHIHTSEGGSFTSKDAFAAARDMIAWARVASIITLDTATSSGSGGTGVAFEHSHTLQSLSAALHELTPERTDCAAVPVIVAGGLSPVTVAAVVRAVHEFASVCKRAAAAAGVASSAPATSSSGGGVSDTLPATSLLPALVVVGVDVSSGVEYDPAALPVGKAGKGHKDHHKVAEFIRQAKLR